jgi:hypothetical protein
MDQSTQKAELTSNMMEATGMLADIQVERVAKPDVEELREFYRRQNCTAPNRGEKLQQMLDNTFCFVSARRNGELIGVARGVTDGCWGRLAECKLDPSCQGPACVTKLGGRIEHDASGVAKQMASLVINALQDFGIERIDAVAYGTEVDFCEELGFKPLPGVVAMELVSVAEAPDTGATASAAAT